MRKILRRKLWEKRCDWRKDQHTDPTTYLAIVQPYNVGLYLVARTRFKGMLIHPVTYDEACRIIGQYYLDSF